MKKIFPLKKYIFPPPATPPPSPAAVYIMNEAPGLYNKITLSKGKFLIRDSVTYIHNDVDSDYPKQIKFFAF